MKAKATSSPVSFALLFDERFIPHKTSMLRQLNLRLSAFICGSKLLRFG